MSCDGKVFNHKFSQVQILSPHCSSKARESKDSASGRLRKSFKENVPGILCSFADELSDDYTPVNHIHNVQLTIFTEAGYTFVKDSVGETLIPQVPSTWSSFLTFGSLPGARSMVTKFMSIMVGSFHNQPSKVLQESGPCPTHAGTTSHRFIQHADEKVG